MSEHLLSEPGNMNHEGFGARRTRRGTKDAESSAPERTDPPERTPESGCSNAAAPLRVLRDASCPSCSKPFVSFVVKILAAARRRLQSMPARWGLAAILLVYLLAGGVYSFIAPLGEAPDEMEQFWYIRDIVEQRRLPRTVDDRLAAGGKSHEPPLYYALLGVATSWVDARPLPQVKMLDPERWPRHSLPDEVLVNFAPLHTADEQWPFRGVVLVWHLARLLSLALMAAALAVIYRVAREIVPQRPEVALLTVAAALAPQLVYIGGSLNNDALAALLGALVAWLLVRLAKGDARWRSFLLLGLLLGLARLTKFYMLALLPEVAIVLLVLAWRRRNVRYALGLLPALALAFAIPAPWLFYIQPVDPTLAQGWGRLAALFDIVHAERWFSASGEGQAGTGALAVARALAGVLRLQPGAWALTLFKSFWGFFGAMTVEAPRPLYAIAAALSGASLLGWARLAWRRISDSRACSGTPDPRTCSGGSPDSRTCSGDSPDSRTCSGNSPDSRTCSGGSPDSRTCSGQGLWIPALQVLAFLATEATFYGVMQRLPDTAQARHLYPALAGLALLLAIGWWGLWRPIASRRGLLAVTALLIGLSGYCLPTVVASMRQPLLPVRSTPWPDAPVTSMNVDLGDGLLLAGARWTAGAPGRVTGTLFWQATQPPAGEAVVVLELRDALGNAGAVWAGHPGGARYPTQAWDAGDHVRQEISWPLPPSLREAAPQLRLRMLRDGVEAIAVDLPFIALPAAPTVAPGAQTAWQHAGSTEDTFGLRDSLLVTWPGGRIDSLVGPGGALWQPLAQTAAGDQAAFVAGAQQRPGAYLLPDAPQVAVTIAGRARTFTLPEGLTPLGTVFGSSVELIGYDMAPGVSPGDTLHLRLAWRALRPVNRHYTVFTHLVDSQGRTWGQHDKLPGQEYSTLFWAPGEVVVDEYTLQVDPAAPAGSYRLDVGLYQALSGARAPAVDAAGQALGDHVLLGSIQVGP